MKAQGTRAKSGTEGGLGRELLGLFAIFCGLLFVLSLATFDGRDPWLNHVVSGVIKVHNKAGLFGSYLAGFFYDIFGAGSWVIPAFFCLAGARRILGAPRWPWWRWTGFALLGICICIAGAASDLGDVEIFARGVLVQGMGNISTHGGGILGHMLYVGMVGWLSATGAFMLWLFCLLLSMQMLTGISWTGLLVFVGVSFWRILSDKTQDVMEKRAERKEARQSVLEVSAIPAGTMAHIPEDPPKKHHTPDPDSAPLPPADVSPPTGPPLIILQEDEADEAAFLAASALAAACGESRAYTAGVPDAPSHAAAAEKSADAPRPDDKRPENIAVSSFLGLTEDRTGEEEDELPPWVLDFEQDRVGVPVPSSAPAFSPEPPPSQPPPSQPTPSPEPDQHVAARYAVWNGRGEAFSEKDGPSAPPLPSPTGSMGEQGREYPSLVPSRSTYVKAASPAVSVSSLHACREMAPLAVCPPAARLSPGTAAAVQALRAAAAGPVNTGTLFPALSTDAGRLFAERQPEQPQFHEPAIAEPATSVAVGIKVPLAASVDTHEIPEGISDAVSPPPTLLDEQESDTPEEGESGSASPGAEYPPAPEEEPSSAEAEAADAIPIFEAPPVAVAQPPKTGLVEAVVRQLTRKRHIPLPSLDLLQAAPAVVGATPRSVLEEKGRSLMTCLNDFSIQGELVGITPGPVVTMFEVRPAPGVRVSRIANLSDDLALALKAVAVRIQAPVPGTDTVGIEIPNEVRETVCLKELLSSQAFHQSSSLLTLALGKDIAGIPAVADLATMPHLLVAGATGAGKSVGINSIILSLLFKARPEEVKLLLIDPKRVEMAIYADLPHLVHPVVTEMPLAKNALEWAVSEMEQRYNAIARAGVRNIADYNAKVASWGQEPPDGMEDLVFIPYMVLIIDELADLMLVAAKEVETSIVRLAQLARAAGIHLILATQRPSVDVVTGLIKANFPCRISFQVTSKHDSRTILDAVGAEHLLGKGDMLFKPGGAKFKRMHGAFVSDQNVNAVVEYWKSQQRPDYQVDFSDWAPEASGSGALSGGGGANGDIASDPLYNEAVEFVRQQGKASISLIQRKFRIGFNKAARFVEQMEQDGIIGPADGSKPRAIIR